LWESLRGPNQHTFWILIPHGGGGEDSNLLGHDAISDVKKIPKLLNEIALSMFTISAIQSLPILHNKSHKYRRV
jgi:hypothetical protein